MEAGREDVRQLALKFEANRAYYSSNQFDESSTRIQFLDPLLSALGWDVTDKARKGAYADVLRERSVVGEVAGVSVLLKPDYTLRIGGQPQLCVEAKRAGIDIDTPERIYQIKNYAWNQSLTVGVLTNFRQLRVFSTNAQPRVTKPWEGELAELHLDFDQLVDAFDHVWDILSHDAVTRGSLARKAVAALGKSLGQRVDRAFLSDLEGWRIAVAKDFARRARLTGWQLTEVSQRLLDRLVFIRVCEDRNIEPRALLRPLLTAPSPVDELKKLVRRLNVQYNGTLFKEHLVDAIQPSEDILHYLIDALYPPRSPYRFDVINVEILGTIYERFLGSEVSVRDGDVKVERQPEVRKSGGVYYTPQWIVDEIVHRVVDPVVAGRPPAQLAKVKILDPACGSGSFLLGALDRIIREYEAYYTAHPSVQPRDHYLGADGRRRLTERKKAQILVDNIFGVDVDAQAVEVTMMSLYLKALEGEDASTLDNQRGQQTSLLQAALLPPLDRNIVCGNSLVEADGFQLELSGLSAEVLRKLNPFDWRDPAYAFRGILDSGGFDAVIGNPPYFNVDATYGRKHPMLEYLRNHYSDVWHDKTDILFYFIDKAMRLSKHYVGFIVSRAFLEAYKAGRLRATVERLAPCVELVDFQGFKVFEAGIATSLIVLDKTKAGSQPPTDVRRLGPGSHSTQAVMAAIRDGSAPFDRFAAQLPADSSPWLLVHDDARLVVEAIDGAWPALGDVATVGQGMQTGENAAFTLSTEDARRHGIPERFLKRRVRNSDISRFVFGPRGEWLLYVEDVLDYMALPSSVRRFLEEPRRRQQLESRAAFRRGDCLWWRYTWPLHKELYGQPRLVCPYRASVNRFVLDPGFSWLSITDTTVVFPLSDRRESPEYWLGLLNSRTLTYRMRRLAKVTGKDMYEYFWNAVAKLPARTIDFDDPDDRTRHDAVVGLVRDLISLAEAEARELSPSNRTALRRRFDSADRALEEVVLDLYGLDGPIRSEVTAEGLGPVDGG